MKTLYFDCGMGAAGDMLTAALLELLPDPEEFLKEFAALGLPGVRMEREKTMKCGISGTYISVTVNGVHEESYDVSEHSHNHSHERSEYSHDHMHEQPSSEHSHNHTHSHTVLNDIEHLVREHLALSEKVKEDIMAVYRLIAEAESYAHNAPVTEIHFHEVGTLDAVADITAVCMLMERLAPEEVVVSPIHVGSGQVHCAHGILPVPAPATAYILKDVPIYGGNVKGELCTPTGASLLKHFATRFGEMPVMKTAAIGYGMGKKDFKEANCVRAFLGESLKDLDAPLKDTMFLTDKVLELSCNLDDMTAEAIGFAMERLFEGGALEVFTLPAGMKKARPGVLLTVLCAPEKEVQMAALLFKHTTTIGIRKAERARYLLERKITSIETPYGTVRRKESEGSFFGENFLREKYEYEDIARIAREQKIGLSEAYEKIQREVEG